MASMLLPVCRWRATIELNQMMEGNYYLAWQKTIDIAALDWVIELLDKDSGYLRMS